MIFVLVLLLSFSFLSFLSFLSFPHLIFYLFLISSFFLFFFSFLYFFYSFFSVFLVSSFLSVFLFKKKTGIKTAKKNERVLNSFLFFLESPSIEFAVSSLSHLIFGYASTPFSILAKLNKNGEVIPILISRTVLGK